jgi:hypothetical protein
MEKEQEFNYQLISDYVKYLYGNIELLVFGNIQIPLVEEETINNIKNKKINQEKIISLVEDLERIYEQENQNNLNYFDFTT